jgi:hypothetical protein
MLRTVFNGESGNEIKNRINVIVSDKEIVE